ncbi:hypothetical protein HWC53_gp167 [Bacillus phage vB_BmeM-Goe8]|uniref:Uncharacterized protein n=1 Tax=Bacillus phage vB_BmeM-Goe8 TaxID=2593638 RepID=A0A516KMV3_9CAUD|nr:hypothetical protein HWC53_gp167 [Bacillus phage vB_BmeM-Goe8]QDP42922.1 hypothetical protein Goe8_c01490 [Bacillus phage vB_BmeM-Goe8]
MNNPKYRRDITKVHTVKKHEAAWVIDNPDSQYLDVELEIHIKELDIKHTIYRIWTVSEWESIKKQGYFIE